jgi:hypothetical protein
MPISSLKAEENPKKFHKFYRVSVSHSDVTFHGLRSLGLVALAVISERHQTINGVLLPIQGTYDLVKRTG